jgi:hypothetical protein
MKKICVVNYNSAIPDLSRFFEILPLDRLPEMDALVVWNEVVGDCIAASEFARSMNIPVFVAAHGWYGVPVTEYRERNVKPNPETYHLLWSESDRALFTADGVKPEKISVVGSPLYDLREPKKLRGPVVLYAPMHADDKVSPADNMGMANRIWAALNDMKGIKPFMKLCRDEHMPASDDKRILFTDRLDPGHVKQIFRILSQVSCVVTHDEGTFSLLAYVMDIPVIKVKSMYPRVTDACAEVDFDGLEVAIWAALADPSKGSAQRRAVVEKAGGPLSESHLVAGRMAFAINNVLHAQEPALCA